MAGRQAISNPEAMVIFEGVLLMPNLADYLPPVQPGG
jgi:hypothetical protein